MAQQDHDAIEKERLEIIASINSRFEKVFNQHKTPAGAALEYAALATARQRSSSPHVSAKTQPETPTAGAVTGPELAGSSAALEQAYGSSAEVVANAMAGKVAAQSMQRSWSMPAIDRIVDICRNLVVEITRDDYFARGKFTAASHDFIVMASEDVVSPLKRELASRLAFLSAALDSGVKKGTLPAGQAANLMQRVESQIFHLRPPPNLHFSDGFLRFYEHHSQSMHHEALTLVRKVLKSSFVVGLDEKLHAVQPTTPKAPLQSRFQGSFDAAKQLLNVEFTPGLNHTEMATDPEPVARMALRGLDQDETDYDVGPRPGV